MKYIARVDEFDDEETEYGGEFLQKVNSKITPGEDTEEPVFINNEEDGALFAPKDIVLKLQTQLAVGESAGRSNQLVFNSTSLHWTWRRPAVFSLYLQASPLVFLWQSQSPTGILFHIFSNLT